MWNELDQATSAKYEKMEAEDKTRCVCAPAAPFSNLKYPAALSLRMNAALSVLSIRAVNSTENDLCVISPSVGMSLLPPNDAALTDCLLYMSLLSSLSV